MAREPLVAHEQILVEPQVDREKLIFKNGSRLNVIISVHNQ